MSVPHIHHWGHRHRDDAYRCLKCGITHAKWKKQMALKSVEHEIEVEQPSGTVIVVSRHADSTTNLEIKIRGEGTYARAWMDDRERSELIAALTDTENVK